MLGCNGCKWSSEPDNILPAASALGSATTALNVRSIKGSELSHLARAMGGRGTIFNVWASWCESCKGELPIIHEFANEHASRGLRVVIVSVDEPEAYSRLPEVAARFGFSPPIWVASKPLGEFKRALAQNWKGNIPVTFLYDSRGNRRFFWDGPVEATELRPVVEDFLAGNNVQGEKHFELSAGATTDDSANVP